jgi:pyridoxal phosphate enzyme (YggS family)
MEVKANLARIQAGLQPGVTLVAVSKTQPDEAVLEAYAAGQRDFGENRVQDLKGKAERLPSDIRWHMIGHIQTNKIKDFIGFVHLVHGVDREKVLKVLNDEAAKAGRTVDALLQIHIAEEDSKFGFDAQEARALFDPSALAAFPHVRICGLMGMATFTDDTAQIQREFTGLKALYDEGAALNPQWHVLSMGMSGDYTLAMAAGSTHVRVGSAIFGARNY